MCYENLSANTQIIWTNFGHSQKQAKPILVLLQLSSWVCSRMYFTVPVGMTIMARLVVWKLTQLITLARLVNSKKWPRARTTPFLWVIYTIQLSYTMVLSAVSNLLTRVFRMYYFFSELIKSWNCAFETAFRTARLIVVYDSCREQMSPNQAKISRTVIFEQFLRNFVVKLGWYFSPVTNNTVIFCFWNTINVIIWFNYWRLSLYLTWFFLLSSSFD